MNGQLPGAYFTLRQAYQAEEKRKLRKDSNFVGAGMLVLTAFMQFTFTVAVTLLSAFGVLSPEAIATDPNLGLPANTYVVFYMLVYIVAMGFPLPLVALIARRNINPFGAHRRVRFSTFLCLVLLGMAICILGNFVASYVLSYLQELFNIPTPESPDLLDPEPVSLLLNVLTIAVLPAVLEEMVFRGYVLQTLRPHGDGLALMVSALLFALMHGNVLQIPFAFIVGLVLGFVVIRTDNLFVAIVIHLLNNLMSVLLDYANQFWGEETGSLLTIVTFTVLAVLGVVAALVLLLRRDPTTEWGDVPRSLLSASERASTMLLQSPAMLVSLLVFILLTVAAIYLV